jgi:hypothetical protein
MYGATGKGYTHYPTCRSQETDAAAPLEIGGAVHVLPLRKMSMYRPSAIPYQQHRGFSRTFTPSHLSLGLFFPLEAFDGDTPSMLNQVALAKRAEALGFCALWFRDVPLRDPGFGISASTPETMSLQALATTCRSSDMPTPRKTAPAAGRETALFRPPTGVGMWIPTTAHRQRKHPSPLKGRRVPSAVLLPTQPAAPQQSSPRAPWLGPIPETGD